MRGLLFGVCASALACSALAQSYDQGQGSGGYSDQGYRDQQSPDTGGNPGGYQGDQAVPPDQDEEGVRTYRSDQPPQNESDRAYQSDRGAVTDQGYRAGDQSSPGGAQSDQGYQQGQSGQAYQGDRYDQGDQYKRGYDEGYRAGQASHDDSGAARDQGQMRSYTEGSDAFGSRGISQGTRYTGRTGASWRDGEGRYCTYREVTWMNSDGAPAYRWSPSCHY